MTEAFDIPGRIKCGTVSAPDFDAALADYIDILGMGLAEAATVSADLAASWGAPAMAGRRTALLTAPNDLAAFIRLVEASPTPHKPLRTHGWAAFEYSVADCDALFAAMPGSGFTVLGPPKPVPGFDNFIPFQVAGRSGEVLYLNQVLKSDMAGLDLPHTTARVGPMFIAVLAAPDRAAALAYHRDVLGFTEGATWTIPYGVINRSFGLADDAQTTMTMTQTGRMPAVEIDQYPAQATPRPVPTGELPPGNAMVTFMIPSLDRLSATFFTPPHQREGPLYAERRSATVIGNAGERIELIEAA